MTIGKNACICLDLIPTNRNSTLILEKRPVSLVSGASRMSIGAQPPEMI